MRNCSVVNVYVCAYVVGYIKSQKQKKKDTTTFGFLTFGF